MMNVELVGFADYEPKGGNYSIMNQRSLSNSKQLCS